MHWAPELIVQRELSAEKVSREEIMNKLGAVEATAIKLVALLEDRAVMRFLQMPPAQPFESELGTRMSISNIRFRAHQAASSPILRRGTGKKNSGRGAAVTTNEVSAEHVCAAIIGETWYYLDDKKKYPIAYQAAADAADAYWLATGGKLETRWGSTPVGKWRPYFKALQDEGFFWGKRKEMKRQLPLYETK